MKFYVPLSLMLAVQVPAVHAASHEAVLRTQHTDYTRGYGTRQVNELEYVYRGDATVVVLGAAHGHRRTAGAVERGLRLDAALYQQWSPRLGTRTALQWGDDGVVFADRGIDQSVVLKLGADYTATAGGRRTRYADGVHANALYVQGARYFPAGMFSLRHTAFRVAGRGDSHATLASLRLNDQQGEGSSTLWLGQGTALRDYDWAEGVQTGRFHSIALQRQQPFGKRWILRASVENAWNDTGVQKYQARGIKASLAARW